MAANQRLARRLVRVLREFYAEENMLTFEPMVIVNTDGDDEFHISLGVSGLDEALRISIRGSVSGGN